MVHNEIIYKIHNKTTQNIILHNGATHYTIIHNQTKPNEIMHDNQHMRDPFLLYGII